MLCLPTLPYLIAAAVLLLLDFCLELPAPVNAAQLGLFSPLFSQYNMNECALLAGTVLTATAHVITTVIGSGILSLTWAISTMGWIAGPVLLLAFAAVTWYTSLLLTDAYRHPKGSGTRNRTYPQAVHAILGMQSLT